MILLYPPHTNVKSIKHNPKASRPPLNVHLLPLSIRLSAPSKETRPNHNIVKALLVFWFKSLFTLFAEYSSAVTAFRQTASPERGLPQPDLSCWNSPFSLHQVEPRLLSWPLGSFHWGGLWASASPLLALGHPHSSRTPVPQNPSWEPSHCLCHLSGLLCQLGTSDNTIGSQSTPRLKIDPACQLNSSLNFLLANRFPRYSGSHSRRLVSACDLRLSFMICITVKEIYRYTIKKQTKKTFASSPCSSPCERPTSWIHPYPLSLHGTPQKWHQLINIHELFTRALLCVLQGLIQTETRLFCSTEDCVTTPFVGETHQLVFQGNVSPHWEPNLPPSLTRFLLCPLSVLRAGSSTS